MSLYAIDRDTGITLYAQIAEVLERDYVRQGAPGDRLPSEGELAARFGVNRHTLRRAVDELPDKLRTVVILKLVEGYSHQEIGELLGIRRGASEVRLSRALARLREKLGGQND